MKREAFALFALCLLICAMAACSPQRMGKKLVTVDTLIFRGQNEEAMAELERIDTAALKGESEWAYYRLLKVELLHKLRQPIESDSDLDYAIQYYKKNSDNRKLAEAYYYKGVICYERDDKREAIMLMKEAEEVADRKDIYQMYKIYESLAYQNQVAEEPELTLKYAEQALKYAEKATNKDLELYALFMVADSYIYLHKMDSAWICINRAEKIIDTTPSDFTAYYLTVVANFYYTKDWAKADSLLDRAMKVNPDEVTYESVARVRFENGDYEGAEEMWTRCLTTKDIQVKGWALEGLADIKQAQGKHEEANELLKQLSTFNDSVNKVMKNNDVKGLQTEYDNKKVVKEKNLYLRYAFYAIAALLIAGAATVIHQRVKRKKTLRQLTSARERLKEYETQIAELKQEGSAQTKEAAKKERALLRKMEKLRAGMEAEFTRGVQLARDIDAGGSTKGWKKEDYTCYIEHCRRAHPMLMGRVDARYPDVSDRYKFVLTLLYLGRSDEAIADRMGTSLNAVRVMKTRLKWDKEKNNDTPEDSNS